MTLPTRFPHPFIPFYIAFAFLEINKPSLINIKSPFTNTTDWGFHINSLLSLQGYQEMSGGYHAIVSKISRYH
jgi:hypothetical protein